MSFLVLFWPKPYSSHDTCDKASSDACETADDHGCIITSLCALAALSEYDLRVRSVLTPRAFAGAKQCVNHIERIFVVDSRERNRI